MSSSSFDRAIPFGIDPKVAAGLFVSIAFHAMTLAAMRVFAHSSAYPSGHSSSQTGRSANTIQVSVLPRVPASTSRVATRSQTRRRRPVPAAQREVAIEKPTTDATESADTSAAQGPVASELIRLDGTSEWAPDSYFGRLMSRIASRKSYPGEALRQGREGTVEVSFLLTKDGRIENVALKTESQHRDLNQAALETIRRLRRFQSIPDEISIQDLALVIPFVYRLN